MNLTESLLNALKANGAGEIFGIPGDFALPYFRIIEESGILPLYTLSHEPGVGFAADATARVRGTLGVAAVTYGAGALNMVNSIASAFAEKSPVVVLSGGPGKNESRSGLLLHHQAKTLDSQFQIYREITCDQTRLDDATTAPGEILRVLASCRRHSQPIYIEIPRDMVAVSCAPVPPLDRAAPDIEALDACVGEILGRLDAATAPVLMVGVEVRRFGLETKVAELARRLGLPVVTSFMGRGLLANANAPLAGTYLGAAGDPEVTRSVESSDGLFLLGVIISDTNFGVSERKIDMRKAIHAFDGRVSMAYHTYPGIALEALVDGMLARTPATDRRFEVKAQVFPRHLPDDDCALAPLDIATAINDLMHAHGRMPIACDIGDCLFTAMDIENTGLVAPGYYATMGFGVPAGLGVQAASGERPLVLVGDGAFQMTGWELGNCRRYGFDPIVIVFNNRSWEMLRTFQPQSRFNDLDDWHYASMASAMGGDGVRVATRRELRRALAEAYARRGRFQMIEAMLPRGVLSPTLERFVAAAKKFSAPPG